MHLLFGLLLRHQATLVAALPAFSSPSSAPPPPMNVRFVEVPLDSPTVEEPPDTPYYSDANRRADRLPKKESPRAVSPGASRPMAPPSGQLTEKKSGQSSGDEEPGTAPKESEGSSRIAQSSSGNARGVVPGLGDSLQNLDRYLPSDGNSWGNVPQEDSGTGVFFDTKGHDLGPWANRVIAIVRSNWIVPVAANLGMKGAVGVSFEVERSGRVLTPQIVTSSGIVSFDQAALNAIRSSNPLPPLPDYFPLPQLSAVFRFYYNMAVPR